MDKGKTQISVSEMKPGWGKAGTWSSLGQGTGLKSMAWLEAMQAGLCYVLSVQL